MHEKRRSNDVLRRDRLASRETNDKAVAVAKNKICPAMLRGAHDSNFALVERLSSIKRTAPPLKFPIRGSEIYESRP